MKVDTVRMLLLVPTQLLTSKTLMARYWTEAKLTFTLSSLFFFLRYKWAPLPCRYRVVVSAQAKSKSETMRFHGSILSTSRSNLMNNTNCDRCMCPRRWKGTHRGELCSVKLVNFFKALGLEKEKEAKRLQYRALDRVIKHQHGFGRKNHEYQNRFVTVCEDGGALELQEAYQHKFFFFFCICSQS